MYQQQIAELEQLVRQLQHRRDLFFSPYAIMCMVSFVILLDYSLKQSDSWGEVYDAIGPYFDDWLNDGIVAKHNKLGKVEQKVAHYLSHSMPFLIPFGSLLNDSLNIPEEKCQHFKGDLDRNKNGQALEVVQAWVVYTMKCFQHVCTSNPVAECSHYNEFSRNNDVESFQRSTDELSKLLQDHSYARPIRDFLTSIQTDFTQIHIAHKTLNNQLFANKKRIGVKTDNILKYLPITFGNPPINQRYL